MPHFDKKQTPWIIAHRGANREAPENTAAAFQAALAYPIDGIELDVQMSADGIPVIYHDKTLQKIGWNRKRISDLPYRELSRIDRGGWFSPEFRGEPLITLEQTLKVFSKRTRLLIEIKSPERKETAEELTNRVLGQIKEHVPGKHQEKIFLLSFDPHILSLAHRGAPHLKYVMNLEIRPSVPGGTKEILSQFPFIFAFCISINRLTEKFVNWAHHENRRVMTWSCNGPKQLSKVINTGVDGIMTDDPGWLTRKMNEHR